MMDQGAREEQRPRRKDCEDLVKIVIDRLFVIKGVEEAEDVLLEYQVEGVGRSAPGEIKEKWDQVDQGGKKTRGDGMPV